MKTKISSLLLLGTLILSACGSLPEIKLGNTGGSVEEAMQLQEIAAEPTEAVLSEGGAFFREEFDGDINDNWGLRVISGLEKQLIQESINGKLRLQTLPPNDTNFIFFNKKNTYKDVVVSAEVDNSGPLDVALSLVCRANENGWYEFRISPSGYYELLRFDQYLKDDGKNAYTNYVEKRVGSTKIVGGLEKNVFALSCVDNLITPFINGEQPYWQKRPLAMEDDSFDEGTVGFGLAGYGQSYNSTFNWIEISKP